MAQVGIKVKVRRSNADSDAAYRFQKMQLWMGSHHYHDKEEWMGQWVYNEVHPKDMPKLRRSKVFGPYPSEEMVARAAAWWFWSKVSYYGLLEPVE